MPSRAGQPARERVGLGGAALLAGREDGQRPRLAVPEEVARDGDLRAAGRAEAGIREGRRSGCKWEGGRKGRERLVMKRRFGATGMRHEWEIWGDGNAS